MRTACHILLVLFTALAGVTYLEARAEACGCLSPPVPVDGGEFAVNQQAEQIIFEVEDAHVSAHVMIRYAGNPESFAWILPVPNLPELELSSAAMFGLVDQVTEPSVAVATSDQCPQSSYRCAYHPDPVCGQPEPNPGNGTADAGVGGPPDGAGFPDVPPVDVLDRQTVGNYDTVVFSAGDTAAAVAWLVAEGFIVNQTMAPYMQPYADAGMLFVAAKLIPGADASEIHPLRVRYQGTTPMIPLKLTAVAAEPHMTVTSYIFGDAYYRPVDLPTTTVDSAAISRDPSGRVNYPMALARAIDDAGGNAFVSEYRGAPAVPDFDQGSGCCNRDFDFCNVQWDGVCSCPDSDFDAVDCAMEAPDLLEGLAQLKALNARHTHVTRLTTRLSPEEMLFDPMFEPDPDGRGLLTTLRGEVMSLAGCESDIIEPWRYTAAQAQQGCAAMYCGDGECVVTANGPGCDCGPGTSARVFNDLDGEPSLTCVPDRAPVDLEAGGLDLPDACAGVSCGAGTCIDLAGVPSCACPAGYAATLLEGAGVPTCQRVQARTGTPGAQDYSAPLASIAVCAPAPPTCGEFGWLEERRVDRAGVQCAQSIPDPSAFEVPDAPTCGDLGLPSPEDAGCVYGCQGSPGSGGRYGVIALALIVLAFAVRRPRAPR